MDYFVYYNDDFCDNGGHGLEACVDIETALNFIEGRLGMGRNYQLSDYILIKGKEIRLKPIETITKIAVV